VPHSVECFECLFITACYRVVTEFVRVCVWSVNGNWTWRPGNRNCTGAKGDVGSLLASTRCLWLFRSSALFFFYCCRNCANRHGPRRRLPSKPADVAGIFVSFFLLIPQWKVSRYRTGCLRQLSRNGRKVCPGSTESVVASFFKQNKNSAEIPFPM